MQPTKDTEHRRLISGSGPGRRPKRLARLLRRARVVTIGLASLPAFQATGCFPDPIGALNFELQSFFNVTILTAINTIVQNVLRL